MAMLPAMRKTIIMARTNGFEEPPRRGGGHGSGA